MIKLYHFPHCPYCIRVRLAFGLLQIPYESIVSRYDDPESRQKLSGKTTVPFVVLDDGRVISDSLSIIEKLDARQTLGTTAFKSSPAYQQMETRLTQLSNVIHPVTWPFWVYTPEFDATSRAYVLEKKKSQRGTFAELFKQKDENLKKVAPILAEIEKALQPFYLQSTISIQDILIASHLWGLYVVPEFQFSEKMHAYLQNIKKICAFNYQQDFWKS